MKNITKKTAKTTWIMVAIMVCTTFAGGIFNPDGSINKNSEAYKKANEGCFNGCDYDDWKIEGDTVDYSVNRYKWGYSYSDIGDSISESVPLYIRFKATLKTDHWNSKTNVSVPVVIKIKTENGFGFYQLSEGRGNISVIKSGSELVYKFNLNGDKSGFRNVHVLQLSSLKSGSVSVEIIYLNESLNRRYGKTNTIYVYPKNR
jgi:hypothetical protein